MYIAPKSFNIKNSSSFLPIKADTPKATNEVCTKHPVTRPKTVAKPYFIPFDTLCTSTKILSGPGANASAVEAIKNDMTISVFKL